MPSVLADLTIAVEVGMLFAALLYINRVSQTTTVAPVTDEYVDDGRPPILQDKLLCLLMSWCCAHSWSLFVWGYGEVVRSYG
ncbi:MAG TPA: hypothetical protein VGQ39_08330 [Pyrinomonadaceae bacterium]|nr:hypothetical protein [Pyrinomonadaceae bacterium]